jgi:hypothetical protein
LNPFVISKITVLFIQFYKMFLHLQDYAFGVSARILVQKQSVISGSFLRKKKESARYNVYQNTPLKSINPFITIVAK